MIREERKLERVVAIGRVPEEGLLCGANGVVIKEPTTQGCEGLARIVLGIEGPLVNYMDGRFVGMNFYDGRTRRTPFLPRSYIIKVLRNLELPPSRRDHHAVQRLDSPVDGTNYSNRWPMPKARWYNDLFEGSTFIPRGRQRM